MKNKWLFFVFMFFSLFDLLAMEVDKKLRISFITNISNEHVESFIRDPVIKFFHPGNNSYYKISKKIAEFINYLHTKEDENGNCRVKKTCYSKIVTNLKNYYFGDSIIVFKISDDYDDNNVKKTSIVINHFLVQGIVKAMLEPPESF